MSKVNVEYYKCDSCDKQVIAIDVVKAKWIMVQGEGSLYFVDKKGDVKNKLLGHYCSKQCFYALIKEEADKMDDAPTVVTRDGLLDVNAYPEHASGKITHIDVAEEF